ncbi:MAG: putative metal-binding motif-containing protein, partial [Candidatus Scalindua sp.]
GDVDEDGYTVAQGDCDDNDASVNPGVTEIADNGKDDDCDPLTLDSSADQALVDSINEQPPLETWELYDILSPAYPISDDVLLAMINRDPLMDAWENADILSEQNPLSENILNAMINEDSLMASSDYADILIPNSPLPQSILDQVIAGIPTTMNSEDRQAVLDENP